ncbi:ATP-binding protein [Streptomyces sp. NPDC056948]|uniref:ATP-binding protein n=1 Tax=Streptomyces sp. NPDC056948 TaxID=3345975 RepID=UPI00363F642A
MSSPAQHVLRPPSEAAAHASASGTSHGLPPGPHIWSLDHCCEDTTLVITELTANAATHAAPGTSSAPEVRLGFRLNPTHLLVTVSDPDDHPPVHAPAGSPLEEHGRGLCIVDALSEEWGWTPCPPAGKTVRVRLSACPPL